MNKEELRKYILEGVVTDLSHAFRSYYSYNRIAGRAKQVNNSSKHWKDLFATHQKQAFREMVISLSRVYDKKRGKNKTVCLDSVLSLCADKSESLPINEPYQVQELMRQERWLANHTSLALETSSSRLIELLQLYHEQQIINEPLASIITYMKSFRDKALAHRDLDYIAENHSIPNYLNLARHAMYMSSILGIAFEGVSYGFGDDDSLVEDDARRGSIYIDRCLDELLDTEGNSK
ncbi:hypothetical protein [Phaeocystidibacter luteus]|uniref:Uncharacterized protein n=1 Tax=Phaeocystidibacter luteus TaxID=911197 RepID=A0A6N6RH00_9FLAO|nr:hypothetical protein [Phaeocystidibacter luteus]KAB2810023.1 hypothetical protein F8C67_09080 [Phaeocystidibacter luteus]